MPEDVARAKGILKNTEAEAIDYHENAVCTAMSDASYRGCLILFMPA